MAIAEAGINARGYGLSTTRRQKQSAAAFAVPTSGYGPIQVDQCVTINVSRVT